MYNKRKRGKKKERKTTQRSCPVEDDGRRQ
jgi:hypothetical protein